MVKYLFFEIANQFFNFLIFYFTILFRSEKLIMLTKSMKNPQATNMAQKKQQQQKKKLQSINQFAPKRFGRQRSFLNRNPLPVSRSHAPLDDPSLESWIDIERTLDSF